MRVPLSWLREFVDVRDSAESISKTLVMAGVGVEGIEGDVLVLEITSNRADLLSIAGVARELALLRGLPFRPPAPALQEAGPAPDTKVEVADFALCPRYTARIVRGLKVGPAPAWVRQKLAAALGPDYAPINSVADITNYVMLETGEPLHAFDLRFVRGNRIVVRPARPGERMQAINAKEYALEESDIVIADAERPVAIAGVMGGKESEIVADTRDVLIEAAMFDPASIRRTSRRLGLASESSYRFERGVDWDAVDLASRRAAQLMAELAGGTVAPGVVDASAPRPAKPSVTVRTARVHRLLGMEVPAGRVRAIVEGLGAKVEKADAKQLTAAPPPHRRDLNVEVDFIEEVARIEGYDRIPTDVQLGLSVAADPPDERVREAVRSSLVAMGAFEVLTWSFEAANAQPESTAWSKGKLLPLRNPKGHVDRTLRSALGPALKRVLQANAGCGEPLHPVFEIARVYFEQADVEHPGEKAVLGVAHPDGPAELRSMLRALFERLQIPFDVAKYGVAEGGVAELDFEKLAQDARLVRKAQPYSQHPAVQRDLAMVFSKDMAWPPIEQAVRALAIPILHEVGYLNHHVMGEKRSIAVRLRFLAPDRTLTGAEVDAAVERVASALASAFSAVRR